MLFLNAKGQFRKSGTDLSRFYTANFLEVITHLYTNPSLYQIAAGETA